MQNVDPVIVPVFLNLLPGEGSAQILPPLSSEAKHVGLIEILMPDPRSTGKQIKFYAIFHMDDVYDEGGTPYTKEFFNSHLLTRESMNTKKGFYYFIVFA